MRKLIAIIVLTLAASGCATSSGQAEGWRKQGYESVANSVGERHGAKAITTSQANKEMAQAARTYFPQDSLLSGTWELLADHAEQMERGAMTKDQYNALVDQAWARFDQANAARWAERQADIEAQQRAALIGGALWGAGRGLQQANPPSVTCNSITHGGQVVTTCR